MEKLKTDLIALGCSEPHIDNFIIELKKSRVSEDLNSSILTMIKELKIASTTPEEFEQRIRTIQDEISRQGAFSVLQLLTGLSLDYGSMHQRNVKLIEELDIKEQARMKEEKEKDAWRQSNKV